MIPALLSFLGLGVATNALGNPVPAIARRVGRNPYAPDLPTQAAIAAPRGLRPGFSGASGSESDFAHGQGIIGPIRQALALPLAPGFLVPNLAPAYYTGPVIAGREPWGNSTRGRPLVPRSTLLEPDYVPPLPRDVAAAGADRFDFAAVFAPDPREGF